jgi:CRISPR/Cas system-associated protein Cas10 (large subunit of type III CRISPR-Cas system)
MEKAPGITLSQAVVKINNPSNSPDNFVELENKLKAQRKKPFRPTSLTGLGIKRVSKTGNSAVHRSKNGELMDSTVLSLQNSKRYKGLNSKLIQNDQYSEDKFPKMFADITDPKKSDWLAVIHADGNSLGKTIQKLIRENGADSYRKFSINLEKSTVNAAAKAFESLKIDPNADKYPIQPVVIGGDDLTVICRADLALKFTNAFLEYFEQETHDRISVGKLSACAGIAFIKEKYPFHYAIKLAEELCSEAKKQSKSIDKNDIPSSLIFHKVQSSFSNNYSEIKERVLLAKESKINFKYGPYGIRNDTTELTNINELFEINKILNKDKSPKSSIHKWLSSLFNNKESAIQLLKRIIEVTDKSFISDLSLNEELKNLEKESLTSTILYDALTILSLEGDK